jgi:uncharacterized protein HemX
MQIKVPGRVPFFGLCPISLRLFLIVSLAFPIGACTMNETQQRVGTGAAIGAAGGALLGGSSASVIGGAALGAGGGYIVDQKKKREGAESENQRLQQENYRLRQELQQQQ